MNDMAPTFAGFAVLLRKIHRFDEAFDEFGHGCRLRPLFILERLLHLQYYKKRFISISIYE